MLEELSALPEDLGNPEVLLADNGYFSQANIKACVAQEINPLIAAGRESHCLCRWKNVWQSIQRRPKPPTRSSKGSS